MQVFFFFYAGFLSHGGTPSHPVMTKPLEIPHDWIDTEFDMDWSVEWISSVSLADYWFNG